MNEMVFSGNGLFEQYEELLLRKNDLKKECFQLEQEYIRVFGEEILSVFHIQIECASKVKTIEFCQAYLNRGEEPDMESLQQFVQQETREMRDHLEKMSQEYDRSKQTMKITEVQLAQVKKIYRRLAKKLHPDMHPEAADSERLQDLWNQVVFAYQRNDLEELKELEVLVSSALNEISTANVQMEIPGLAKKIDKLKAEIQEIMDTDPYQYKFLLDDPEAVKAKKESLEAQRKNYEEYSLLLDKKLEGILPEGTIIFWEGRGCA